MAKKKSKMEKRNSQAATTRRKRNKKQMERIQRERGLNRFGEPLEQDAKVEDNTLTKHGMTIEQQHGATMRAAAVPVSDFEGEHAPLEGFTYNSPGAQLLQRILWEAQMRRATGMSKLGEQFSGEGESNE